MVLLQHLCEHAVLQSTVKDFNTFIFVLFDYYKKKSKLNQISQSQTKIKKYINMLKRKYMCKTHRDS